MKNIINTYIFFFHNNTYKFRAISTEIFKYTFIYNFKSLHYFYYNNISINTPAIYAADENSGNYDFNII